MRSNIHWIEAPLAGRLAIVPRQSSGDWLNDESAGWKAEGVDLVVGLLESEEVAEVDLHSEAGLCYKQAMHFVSFPVPDRGVPQSRPAALAVAARVPCKVIEGRAQPMP